MSTSARYEDLWDDLRNLKEKMRQRLKQNISEGTVNNLVSEGDGIVMLMKKEAEQAPGLARNEMLRNWSLVTEEWTSFKRTCKTSPATIIGIPEVSGAAAGSAEFQLHKTLVKGTSILERTSQSVWRASQVAQESEQIGTEVVNELGTQRESLVRTRERLTETDHGLKRTHVMLKVINRRVLTNKCLLFVIIFFEVLILGALVYLRFIKK